MRASFAVARRARSAYRLLLWAWLAARLPPLLGGLHDLGPFAAEPLEVQVLDVLRQRDFPLFLAVVGDAELSRVEPELASHLHLCMRQVIPLARVNPLLNRRRKGGWVLSHAGQHMGAN